MKETRLKFSRGRVTVLWKLTKLTNTQLNKLKSVAKK